MRYRLRRALRGMLDDLPLFSVDAQGRAEPLSALALVEPQGTYLALPSRTWPLPEESRDGWWDGLPYPVYAMRPAGYLGRLFARAGRVDLAVPEDPDLWTDEDILWALSRRGADVAGNLILGNAAYELWLRDKIAGAEPLEQRVQPEAYFHLAADMVQGSGGFSSAAGEFPKFTAMRDLDGARTPHVIVKFSGASGSGAERRWADLLVCEHLAMEHVRTLRVDAARSRILEHGGRMFLESQRFDREGRHGRLAVCALDAIDAAFFGSRATDWPLLAARLSRAGVLDDGAVPRVEKLWWFGRLIANTDMHTGNISLFIGAGRFHLAPAYDMLPMAYAPLAGGEVPSRSFDPPLPLPAERTTWSAACGAAIAFWRAGANDGRISEAFRGVCRENAVHLERVAGQV